MRIGIDLDGVVSDSYTAWLPELNRYYGKNITVLEEYDIHLVYDVSWEDMNDFFVENMEHLFMMPRPVSGAKEVIHKFLRQGHEIYFVTARRPEDEETTLRWLKKHEIPYDAVLFSNFKSKVDLIQKWEVEIFIEDYPVNAEMIAASGVPVLLLDASYNRCGLPRGVKRCQDWPEIFDIIKRHSTEFPVRIWQNNRG